MKIPARYVRIDGELTREARQILAALTCPTFDVGTALTLFAQGRETLDEIDLRLWAELDDAARRQHRVSERVRLDGAGHACSGVILC